MKTLIIGSSGFLGSTLLSYLLNMNLEVEIANRSIDKSFFGKQHDINNLQKINDRFDKVFFLAAYIPSEGKLKQNDNTNILLAEQVAKHFKNSRIIYSSSVSVYGDIKEFPINESHLTIPITPYAKSKLIGEEIISSCDNYSILRFSSLYGPQMTAQTFITKIISTAIVTKQINLHDPNRKQDYLYIDDAIEMLYKIGVSDYIGTVNAVNGIAYSNKEVVNLVANIVGNINIINFGGKAPSFEYSRVKWDKYFDTKITTLSNGLKHTIYSKFHS